MEKTGHFYFGLTQLLVTVYHFLNSEGLILFPKWFEKIKAKLINIDGFIGIQYKISNEQGHAKITLLFKNEAKLEPWAKSQQHNSLVAELDPYRTKPWESVRELLPT